jgi:hypothetical protein
MSVYWLKFGSGNPTMTTGLSPTFVFFGTHTGVTIAPPGITQPISNFGFYQFSYVPTLAIAFTVDGVTTSLGSDRFISGSLDPSDDVTSTLSGMGVTLVAIGNSTAVQNLFIGSTSSSFGSTSVDPTDAMGYLKRILENLEGNALFTKSTGIWQLSARDNTILAIKTITDSALTVTKA